MSSIECDPGQPSTRYLCFFSNMHARVWPTALNAHAHTNGLHITANTHHLLIVQTPHHPPPLKNFHVILDALLHIAHQLLHLCKCALALVLWLIHTCNDTTHAHTHTPHALFPNTRTGGHCLKMHHAKRCLRSKGT